MEFKDQKEAENILEWWKKKLFLTDWIIKINLVCASDMPDDAGVNHLNFMMKSSSIDIAQPDKGIRERIVKFCAEETLAHELLHCKDDILIPDKGNYASVYLDERQHQLLEEMAKSLIMAKYDLPYDWFKNF